MKRGIGENKFMFVYLLVLYSGSLFASPTRTEATCIRCVLKYGHCRGNLVPEGQRSRGLVLYYRQ